MSHVTCAFSTLGVAHRKITENRIAFEILSAIRLPWWVDAMVNLSVLMAVVFFWRFRLRVVPHSLSPSCVTHKKTSRKKFHASIFFSRFTYGHAQLSESGNTASQMAILYFVKQKRFVGQGRLESPSLLESVKRKAKTNKIDNKKTQQQQQQTGQNKWNHKPVKNWRNLRP